VLHDDLYELPPLAAYTSGRVALVGDAAHAMTPNLGQGAGQALEDAVVLAKTVDGPSGLDAYDRLRRPRTQKIALRSHRIGVAAQWASPAAVTLRNTALRMLPGSSFVRSLGPVLDWTA
jgi:2-polyprenyl-6-methoxyphenol hydroxylase-like FAD-dependent oxidoreductase